MAFSARPRPSPDGLNCLDSSVSLKRRALRHLARREHSRAELERKLAPYVQDTEETSAEQQIARALDELAAGGLLSDERTAQSVLSGKGPRFGSLRLKQNLLALGLAPELVVATLAQARGTEEQRAREVWRRRFGHAPADAGERARQMRFMAGRGFDTETIRRVVSGAGED